MKPGEVLRMLDAEIVDDAQRLERKRAVHRRHGLRRIQLSELLTWWSS